MGQTVTIVGTKSNATVKAGDKFRATWRWALAEFGAGAFFDSRRFDLNVQEALPGMGFIPVSSPSAQPGDEVIVYDVRLSQSWGAGRTVADVVAALDKLPLVSDIALDVSRVEALPLTLTSAQLADGQAQAREQGNIDSQQQRETDGIFSGLASFTKTLGTVTALAVVAVAGFIAWSWRKRA